MGTDCISKISVSVCEDIYTASVQGAKNLCLIITIIEYKFEVKMALGSLRIQILKSRIFDSASICIQSFQR